MMTNFIFVVVLDACYLIDTCYSNTITNL